MAKFLVAGIGRSLLCSRHVRCPAIKGRELTWRQIEIEGKERRFLIDRPAIHANDSSVLSVIHGLGSDPSTQE